MREAELILLVGWCWAVGEGGVTGWFCSWVFAAAYILILGLASRSLRFCAVHFILFAFPRFRDSFRLVPPPPPCIKTRFPLSFDASLAGFGPREKQPSHRVKPSPPRLGPLLLCIRACNLN